MARTKRTAGTARHLRDNGDVTDVAAADVRDTLGTGFVIPVGGAEEKVGDINLEVGHSVRTLDDYGALSRRDIDQLAYIRFASVYHAYDDIETLQREVDRLIKQRPPV